MPTEWTDLADIKMRITSDEANNTTFTRFDIPDGVLDPGITSSDDDFGAGDDDLTSKRIMLDVYIWGFLATFMVVGIFLNILAIQTLFRAKCNGTRYFLLQIAFCDIGLLAISGLELFYINYRKWLPMAELCPVYLGLESFTNTATFYFIIAINLHSISMYNLARKTIQRQNRVSQIEYNELAGDQTDDDHYEVINIHHKRQLTIDYSKRKSGIAVILPALFIWFLAASISIPLFVFGNVIPNEANPMICGVVNIDNHNNRLMQILVLVLRIIIPSICLLLTFTIVIVKMLLVKKRIQPCGLDENVSSILKLAIMIDVSFLVLSTQRIYGSLLMEVLSKPFLHYKYPDLNRLLGLVFSMLSFLLPVFRPIIYYTMDRGVRKRFWTCCPSR